jgi:hypothetical protein
MVTVTMSPIALIFTASRKADIIFEVLSRGMTGFRIKTKTNEGRKMAIVDITAPGTPETRYPTKVAVLKTGPGVNCPMATASRSY